MIFECKHWKENLNDHTSQLHRYFGVTKTKFGILTNGLEYRFYTDLVRANVMDENPFLVFNLSTIRDSVLNEVNKFHKENFNEDRISLNATTLKNLNEIKKIFNNDVNEPSQELIKYFIGATNGRATQKTIEQFQELIPKALNQVINERVNDRLHSAIAKEQEVVEEEPIEQSKIVTTEEELEGYRIVQAIVRKSISLERVFYRDTQSYFGILLDNNNRKPICRLHFNGRIKYVGVFDKNKSETKHIIDSLEDIYTLDEYITASLKNYQ